VIAAFDNFPAARFGAARPLGIHDRARAEMRAFDRLPPEIRRAIAEGPFGPAVADLLDEINRRGSTPQERERCAARGVVPCTENVLVERIAILEQSERERIARELEPA
jgi:hypothetical protein